MRRGNRRALGTVQDRIMLALERKWQETSVIIHRTGATEASAFGALNKLEATGLAEGYSKKNSTYLWRVADDLSSSTAA